MDTLVMELSDRVAALTRENKRLRAAAADVIARRYFNTGEELEKFHFVIRKMEIELSRFSPSMTGKAKKGGRRP